MNINYLQVGEHVHCLVCHIDMPRATFLDHFHADHVDQKITKCTPSCGHWYTEPIVDNLVDNSDWRKRFDDKFGDYGLVSDIGMLEKEVAFRLEVKAFIAELLEE